MKRHLFSILAIPMVFLAQCAPQCAPAPGPAREPAARARSSRSAAIETYGVGGHLGADWLGAGDRQICTARDCGYWALRNFQPNGTRRRRRRARRTGRRRRWVASSSTPTLGSATGARNDAWNTGVPGGLHVWNPDGRALNGLRLPFGPNGAFHFVGSASAGNAPVADGRLRVYAFQLVNKDATPGAFNISTSRNSQWTAGYVWPGTYILELGRHRDRPDARKACVDLAPRRRRPHQPRRRQLRPARAARSDGTAGPIDASGRGDVADPVEPAEQDGDRPRVVAQAVAGAGEQAELGVAVGLRRAGGRRTVGTLSSSSPCITSSGRGAKRRAASVGRKRRNARLQSSIECGKPGERMAPISRACSRKRRGCSAQSSKSARGLSRPQARTRGSSAPTQMAIEPPVFVPSSTISVGLVSRIR